jgi:hypothetical protein
MKAHLGAWMLVFVLAMSFGRAAAVGQADDTPEKHITAAKEAAGTQWAGMFDTLCVQSLRRVGHPPAPGPGRGAQPGPPPRESYHMEPVMPFAASATREESISAAFDVDGFSLSSRRGGAPALSASNGRSPTAFPTLLAARDTQFRP